MATTVQPTEAMPEAASSDTTATVAPALSYPFTNPVTKTECLVHRLNNETFPVEVFGRIDDIFTYGLLKKKRCKSKADKTFHPQRVFPAQRPTGRVMDQLFPTIQPIIRDDTLSPEEKGNSLGRLLVEKHAEIFPPDLQRCIEHLAIRYTLFRNWVAPFAALKKDFISGNITAVKDIPIGTVVLELCSSVSSNEFQLSPEIVSPHELPLVLPQVEGTASPRLLLGPLRFAQHDCEPNCEVIPIPNTHAYGIRTLRDIETDQHLTVDRRIAPYTGYIITAECHCRTCSPPPPPVPTPPPPTVAEGETVAGVEATLRVEITKVLAMPRSASEERELRSKRKCEARKRRFDQELAQLKKEDRQWQERERKRLRQAEREETRDGI